jgi:hypothetical protein
MAVLRDWWYCRGRIRELEAELVRAGVHQTDPMYPLIREMAVLPDLHHVRRRPGDDESRWGGRRWIDRFAWQCKKQFGLCHFCVRWQSLGALST